MQAEFDVCISCRDMYFGEGRNMRQFVGVVLCPPGKQVYGFTPDDPNIELGRALG